MSEKVCKPDPVRLNELLGNADLEKDVKIFKLLANPIRLKIAFLLCHGELCTCDLEKILGVDQTLISHHMRPFKDLDLVNERRDWKWRYYLIKDETVKKLFVALRGGGG